MNLPGGWELVLVVLVIMVLFGAKRLPEASRSLGRSLRIFKAETKGLRDDDGPSTTTTAYDARPESVTPAVTPPVTPPPPPSVPPPVPPVPPTADPAAAPAHDATQPRQP